MESREGRGNTEIPAIMKEFTDAEARLHSLIEDIDREDLTSAERERAVTELWGIRRLEDAERTGCGSWKRLKGIVLWDLLVGVLRFKVILVGLSLLGASRVPGTRSMLLEHPVLGCRCRACWSRTALW